MQQKDIDFKFFVGRNTDSVIIELRNLYPEMNIYKTDKNTTVNDYDSNRIRVFDLNGRAFPKRG